MAISEREIIAATRAALNQENEVRRALIRGLLSEAGRLQERRRAIMERSAALGRPSILPDCYFQEIADKTDQAKGIAYDIASLSAGRGYFVRNEIQGWDVRRIMEEIQAA